MQNIVIKKENPKNEKKLDSNLNHNYNHNNILNLPISNEALLKGHKKTVSTISLDRIGNRLVSGSFDNSIRFWDFFGMSHLQEPFRNITPEEGYPINSVKWNNQGSLLMACSGSPSVIVYTRDGVKKFETPKGDMYIKDMTHTAGHILSVNGCCWHPKNKNHFLTWSIDGTIRLWDLNHKKKNIKVIKIRSRVGGRHNCSTATISEDGNYIFGASNDGSIQFWDYKHLYRPKIIHNTHESSELISSLLFSVNEQKLYSRGCDHTVKIWDFRKFKKPIKIIKNLPCENHLTSLKFSPNKEYILTGTSVDKKLKGEDGYGMLKFISVKELEVKHSIPISKGNVIDVEWNYKINQIVIGSSDNNIHLLYDPKFSKNGILVSLNKKENAKDIIPNKIYKSDVHYSYDNIYCGLEAEDIELEYHNYELRRKRDYLDRKDPIKSHQPTLPVDGPFQEGRLGSITFAESVYKNAKRDISRDQNPREALLKYELKSKTDPLFFKAYNKSQPKPVFDKREYDEDGNLVYKKKKNKLF